MGYRIIPQARGKGGPRYKAPSHRYLGQLKYAAPVEEKLQGEVMDLVNSVGHSCPLMIVKYENGDMQLTPAPLGIKKGDTIYRGKGSPVGIGNILKLKDIPTGTPVYNLEIKPKDGGKLVRTSGTAAFVVTRGEKKIMLKMPSKKVVGFNPDCRATIGVIAGGGRTEKPWVKSGKRWHAKRAKNKIHNKASGVAQNAADHPMGGTHRRTKGRATTRSRNAPPGRKVGLLAARKTGRGK